MAAEHISAAKPEEEIVLIKTPKDVERAKAPGRYRAPMDDCRGLYLQVTPAGKSWLFRFVSPEIAHSAISRRKVGDKAPIGKPREMGLGAVGAVSLAEAREKARDARKLIAQGIDPIKARRDEKVERMRASAKLRPFSECAREFIRVKRAGWKNAKHAAQWETTLETYCYPKAPATPVWNALLVSDIDTDHVTSVLEPLWNTKTETAKRLRGRIESILDWAATKTFREPGLNPARWKGHLDKLLVKPSKVAKVKHHAALSYDQAPAFLQFLRTQDGSAARALELIILTATRTTEALNARWAEFDLDNAVWTIPANRMKAGQEHRVPLSQECLTLLRGLKKGATGEGLVFISRKTKRHPEDRPLSNNACLALIKRMKRKGMVLEVHFTTHGFRSTFRDWAGDRTHFARDVMEMSLAHAIKDKTEAAYRRGDMLEKRAALMQEWASHCANVKPAATVVQMQQRRRKS